MGATRRLTVRVQVSFVLAVVGGLTLCLLVQPGSGNIRTCPNLLPVPIDEHFLYSQQPSDGFYAVYSSGEDGSPSYTARKMNKRAMQGSVQTCIGFKVKIGGVDMMSTPPTKCTSKSHSARYCETGADGPAGVALASAGIKMVSTLAAVIVDTDNKTFVAIGFCCDGAFYEWGIFATRDNNKQLLSKTAKALSITLSEIRENDKRRVQFSRIKIEKGECSGSGIMAGVSSVRDGLSGLFG